MVCCVRLQTGFFNSTQPLMKGILMDYVPKSACGTRPHTVCRSRGLPRSHPCRLALPCSRLSSQRLFCLHADGFSQRRGGPQTCHAGSLAGTRGRWSAVDSLTSFGWSVTTIFGSMIVDNYCYSYLFFTTAGCMVLSALPFGSVLRFASLATACLVPYL